MVGSLTRSFIDPSSFKQQPITSAGSDILTLPIWLEGNWVFVRGTVELQAVSSWLVRCFRVALQKYDSSELLWWLRLRNRNFTCGSQEHQQHGSKPAANHWLVGLSRQLVEGSIAVRSGSAKSSETGKVVSNI
jgi:hypothetical protein